MQINKIIEAEAEKAMLTLEQKQLIKDFEGYYGDIPNCDKIKTQDDIEPKIKSLKQGLWMLYSAGEITEGEHSEAEYLLNKLFNSTLLKPTT